jgi:thiamine pyrophosphate-dependent acetolactate synthase large subunit-like protein
MSDETISPETISAIVENEIHDAQTEQEIQQDLEVQTDALQTLIMQVANLQAQVEQLISQSASHQQSEQHQPEPEHEGEGDHEKPQLVEVEQALQPQTERRSGLLL